MKDRRITKTRKSIQNAYLNLLRQKGTEKITISDIAREADIDRKTFYLHYDSTEDIIREYAEEKTRELLTRLTIRSFFSLSFDRKIFAKEVNSMQDGRRKSQPGIFLERSAECDGGYPVRDLRKALEAP